MSPDEEKEILKTIKLTLDNTPLLLDGLIKIIPLIGVLEKSKISTIEVVLDLLSTVDNSGKKFNKYKFSELETTEDNCKKCCFCPSDCRGSYAREKAELETNLRCGENLGYFEEVKK